MQTKYPKDTSRNLIKNTFGILFIRTVARSIGLVNRILIARLYGAYLVGIYSLVLSYLQQILLFVKFGFDRYIQIHFAIPNRPQHKISLFKTALRISLGLTLIIIIIGWFIATPFSINVLNNANYAQALKIGLVILIPWIILEFTKSALVGNKQTTLASLIDALLPSLLFFIFILVEYYKRTLPLYNSILLILWGSALTLSSIVGIILFLRKHPLRRSNSPTPKDFLKHSAKIFATDWLAIIAGTLITTLQGRYCTIGSIGVLATLKKINMLLGTISQSIVQAFSPYLGELYHKGNKRQLTKLITKGTIFMTALLLPITLIILAGTKYILLLLGKDFSNWNILFYIVLLSGFIDHVTSLFGITLIMAKKQNELIKISMIKNIFLFITSILLLPKYHIMGAAITEFLGIIVERILLTIYLKKFFYVQATRL